MLNPAVIERTKKMTLFTTFVVVFMLQAYRVFFSLVFGFAYDIVMEATLSPHFIAGMALLLLFLVMTPFLRRFGMGLLIASGVIILAARIPLSIDAPVIRFYASLAIVAASGWYMMMALPRMPAREVALSSGSAILVLMVISVLNSSLDITMQQGWVIPQIVISLVLGSILFSLRGEKANGEIRYSGFFDAFTLGAFFFIELNFFSQPHVLARWTETSYSTAVPVHLLMTLVGLFAVAAARRITISGVVTGIIALAWGAGGILAGHLGKGVIPLVAMSSLQVPVMLAMTRMTDKKEPCPGNAAVIPGILFFIVATVIYSFTFVYADLIYAFKGGGVWILLFAMGIMLLSCFKEETALPSPIRPSLAVLASFAVLVTGSLVSLYVNSLDDDEQKNPDDVITVVSYNVHYGYNDSWQYTLTEMARTIAGIKPDIVFLQEVDSGRVTSYGTDMALWLGNRLRMRSYFLPCIEHQTGIALLSRLRAAPEVIKRLIESRLEQSGIIKIEIPAQGGSFSAFATWLGLTPAERHRQLDDILPLFKKEKRLVFGGDLNLRPEKEKKESEYRRLIASGLSDSFVDTGKDKLPTSPAPGAKERIDYILHRGFTVIETGVHPSTASDHHMVWARMKLRPQGP